MAAAENEPGLVPYTLVIAAAWFAGLRCRRTRTPPERHMAIWVVEVVVQVIVLLVSRVVRNVWCVRGRFDLYCDKPHRRVRGANHAGGRSVKRLSRKFLEARPEGTRVVRPPALNSGADPRMLALSCRRR